MKQCRIGTVGRAFLACLISGVMLSGCTPQVSSERIQAFIVNRSNSVIRATLIVSLDRVSSMKPTYYMKTNHGVTTQWRAERATRSGGATIVSIVPEVKNKSPKANDGVIAYYYDPRDGNPNVTPPALVLPYMPPQLPPPIFDQDFSTWTGIYPDLSPLGWSVGSTDRASYDIRPFTADNHGVQVSVAAAPIQNPGAISTPIPDVTASVALSQPAHLTDAHLRVLIRPYQPCIIEKGRVVVATGVQISSESGPSELFCIGRSPYNGPARMNGRTLTAEVVPGRIGDWNDVVFNLAPTLRSKKSPIELSLVADLNPAMATYNWITMDVNSVQSAR